MLGLHTQRTVQIDPGYSVTWVLKVAAAATPVTSNTDTMS